MILPVPSHFNIIAPGMIYRVVHTPMYFISFRWRKPLNKKLNWELSAAMPFTRSFTYNGSKINGENFQSTYEGNVIMPAIPFWFKLGFQFNSGKNRNKISREKEEIDNSQKKGF